MRWRRVAGVDLPCERFTLAFDPIGLTLPTLERASQILFSGHGLVWYAPAALLAPFGLVSLVRQGRAKLAVVVAVAFGSLFLVNAAHPTWTGGWSTGPRYLISGLPLLFVPTAALLAKGRRLRKWLFGATMVAGFVVCLASTACTYSGRLPDLDAPGGENPLVEAVVPDIDAGRFDWNLGNLILYGQWEGPPAGNWWCLAPLVVWWEVVGLAFVSAQGRRRGSCPFCAASSGPGLGLADGPWWRSGVRHRSKRGAGGQSLVRA